MFSVFAYQCLCIIFVRFTSGAQRVGYRRNVEDRHLPESPGEGCSFKVSRQIAPINAFEGLRLLERPGGRGC